jgi:hypothetical protein
VTNTLERLISFSIDRAPSKICIFTDAHYLKKMRASHNLNRIRRFIIAFSSLTISPKRGNTRFKHKVLNILDATVKLRVYIPSYNNRVREEVTVLR